MATVSFSIANLDVTLLSVHLAVLLIALAGCVICAKPISRYFGKRGIRIDALSVMLGGGAAQISYCRKDREIAYKLWIEMSTRKIGMPFDEEHDVIVEVYNSWYEFFGLARNLLKEIPERRLVYAKELIDLTEKVLNDGMRPHLTEWQAKFRKWYDCQPEGDPHLAPQDVQRKYPLYDLLVADIRRTNKLLMEYQEVMYRIAFDTSPTTSIGSS